MSSFTDSTRFVVPAVATSDTFVPIAILPSYSHVARSLSAAAESPDCTVTSSTIR